MLKWAVNNFQIVESTTEDVKALFCFCSTLKMSTEGKTEADLVEDLQNLVDQDIKASYIKGKEGDELKAVTFEII